MDDRLPIMQKNESWRDQLQASLYMHPFTEERSALRPAQYKSFQSAAVLRSVPIMRRHLDSFGGRTFSLPSKTKAVPFHTGRFIFDPHNRPAFLEELTQNQRLQAEMAMMEKVRGLKRKREAAIEHRWGYREMNLAGQEMQRGERYSLQAEVQKLKELILPPYAREIYTGRGIRLPETHHTVRPVRVPVEEVSPQPPPPSAMRVTAPPPTTAAVGGSHHMTKSVPPTRPTPGQIRTGGMTHDKQSPMKLRASPPFDLMVQSVPVPGIAPSPTFKMTPVDNKPTEGTVIDENSPLPEPAPVMKMHEQVEQIEFIEPEFPVQDEEDADKVHFSSPPVDAASPVARTRSMAAASITPFGRSHTNPLRSTSAAPDENAVDVANYEKLRAEFAQLDEAGVGSLTCDQLMASCPEELSIGQRHYCRAIYEQVCQTQVFGAEEFVAMSQLFSQLQKLSGPLDETFDRINAETLDESLTQYTELFSSVDRTGRGSITVSAVMQILGTTIQRPLEPDSALTGDILQMLDKNFDGEVSRIEFLAFLPYFLQLEDSTS